jgi:predicted dehydrogenase
LDRRRHRFSRKGEAPAGKLSCGLIGAGDFFHYAYLPALNRKTSPLQISGILTRNEKTFCAARAGLRYQTNRFADLKDLLNSGSRCAVILLPNHLHVEFARRALDGGRHVFCEKPLAPNVAEALVLKSVLQKSGRILMVDFNERYLDRNRVLRHVIGTDRIGKIVSAHAFHNQNLVPRLKSFAKLHRDITGGGVVHNAGIHFINLFLHWFGALEKVHALFENRSLPKHCGEDTAKCRFWFRSGVTATLEASLANAVPTSYECVRLVGEKGEITSDLKRSDIVCRPKTNRPLKIPCRRELMADSVFNALEHFERCVRSGSSPETDIDDSIKTLKVIEALTVSAQCGAEVQMNDIEKKYAS